MMGSIKGVIDLSNTEEKTQGVVEDLASEDIASGVLTYYANKEAGKEVFFQTLGEDSYPVPFSASKSVKQISLTETGYATYVAEGNVLFPSPLQAYSIVSVSNDHALLSDAITEAPIGEPVLVKGAEGKYCYNPVESAVSPISNLLQAATEDIVCDGTQYILADGHDGVGFYKVTPGSTIHAGKAYLIISGNKAKSFYGLQLDDETPINEVLRMKNEESLGGAVYNLAGQKLNCNLSNCKLHRGVYIVNGQKKIRH